MPGTAHARLVYVDDAHLAAAAAELALRHRVFVVVGDMGPGGVAQALAPLLAGCVVTGVRVEEGMAGVLAAAGVDRVGASPDPGFVAGALRGRRGQAGEAGSSGMPSRRSDFASR